MRPPARFVAAFLVTTSLAGEGGAEQMRAVPPAEGREGGWEEASSTPALLDDLLGTASKGFAMVMGPRPMEFPADHGPHPEYRSEWWYFTGNLESEDGSRYGFQLTFFRFRLSPNATPRRSEWAADQVYMAHFAVTDVEAGRFHAFERFSRGALDLAGARASPFKVWLEDWSAAGQGGSGDFAARLQASEAEAGIDLEFGPGEGPVLHGDGGFSRKSAVPGYASYYYSYPRMPVTGRLRTPRGSFEVEGEGWLDREWSSSALASDQAGWDWFALRLSDGSELMLYQLRRRDGGVDPFSYGVLIDARGTTLAFGPRDFTIAVTKSWQPADKSLTYPAGWRLRLPAAALDLEVLPLVDDQEWRQAFRYWEGAVSARGRSGSLAVSGSGYVELTGYAESARETKRDGRVPDP